jgi:hypothetical protein
VVLSSLSSSSTSSSLASALSRKTGSGDGISHHHMRQVVKEEARARHNSSALALLDQVDKEVGLLGHVDRPGISKMNARIDSQKE